MEVLYDDFIGAHLLIKRCNICLKYKTMSQFHNLGRTKYKAWACRVCFQLKIAQKRKENIEKHRAYGRKAYHKRKEEITRGEWDKRLNDPTYDNFANQRTRRSYHKNKSERLARVKQARLNDPLYPQIARAKWRLLKVNYNRVCSLCKSTRNVCRHWPDYNKPDEHIIICRHCLSLKLWKKKERK